MANVHAWKASQTMNRSLSRIVSWYSAYKCKNCSVRQETNPDIQSPTVAQNLSAIKQIRLLLEVHASIGIVNVRYLEGKKGANGGTTLLHVITPDFLSGFLSKNTVPGTEGCQITRVAWHGACPLETCGSSPSLAILMSPISQNSSDMVLVVLRFDNIQFGPRVTAKYDVEAPEKGHTVSDLAITTNGDPMIMWTRSQNPGYKFVAYRSFEDSLNNSRHLIEEVIHDFPATMVLDDRVSSIHALEDTFFFSSRSIPMPLWKGTPSRQGWTFARENTNLPELHALWSSDATCIPITHYHHHRIEQRDLHNGAPTCVNTALKLIINREVNRRPNVIPSRRGVFVLKSVHFPHGCKRFNPYARNGILEHLPVAYLADPPNLESLPSIGMKIAISPRKLRIALAAWRTVRIYSIDPLAFLSPKYSYGSAETHSRYNAHDFAFVERCGWSYYSNAVRENGCVVLEPVDLPSTGVIYAMDWTDENELWALTNEGICKWDIGVHAKGQKSNSELTPDDSDLELRRKY